MDEPGPASVRLDQWLWAARFFRSRSLAKQAIEGGKVQYEGERSKVSRHVQLGARLRIRQGRDELEVVVRGLSATRAAAPIARQLYEETPESRQRREEALLQRRAAGPFPGEGRPTKKERRQLQCFKRGP